MKKRTKLNIKRLREVAPHLTIMEAARALKVCYMTVRKRAEELDIKFKRLEKRDNI